MDVNNPRMVNRAARLMLKLKLKGNLPGAVREQFNEMVKDIISGKVRIVRLHALQQQFSRPHRGAVLPAASKAYQRKTSVLIICAAHPQKQVPENIITILQESNTAEANEAATQELYIVSRQPVSLLEYANICSLLVNMEPAFKTMASVSLAHKMGLFTEFDDPPQQEDSKQQQENSEQQEDSGEAAPQPSNRKGRKSPAKTPAAKKQHL